MRRCRASRTTLAAGDAHRYKQRAGICFAGVETHIAGVRAFQRLVERAKAWPVSGIGPGDRRGRPGCSREGSTGAGRRVGCERGGAMNGPSAVAIRPALGPVTLPGPIDVIGRSGDALVPVQSVAADPWDEADGRADVKLVGRAHERRALDQTLDVLRRGQPSTLVVRGEPGIGKTALLEYLRDRATGSHVVAASAVHSERKLAFAGLHQ